MTVGSSWRGQALLVCGAFLLVGIATVDDYGTHVNGPIQRRIADRNLAFITGAADRLNGFHEESDKYYGVAFELPLLLFERGLGLEDSRGIFLMRHLVPHGFFLVGGWCCSLLVYRLTDSRVVALFALTPYVWTNPFAFVTAWQTPGHYPVTPSILFQGQ